MNDLVLELEQHQFITKEFAEAVAGKQPHPYLRTHDVVQQELLDKVAGLISTE